jgi:integrase
VGDPVACAFPIRLTPRRAAEDKAGRAEVLRRSRDRALILLGFCAALRRSEIVALDVDDITQDGPRGLLVSIRRSKTDQEGVGATVAVPYGGLGTDTAEALEAWTTLASITSGPLFRRVDRHGNVGEDRLTPEAANRIVQDRGREAGVDASGLSAHSLRAGYVTAQARRNTPEHRIQAVTRHRSAEVLRGYIREATVMDRTPDLVLE